MSQPNDFGANPYYGNGNTGGGGYLTGGSPFGSASGSPGGVGRRDALSQSLRPLNVKQLVNATQAHADADWTVENNQIGQVTVVAQIVSIQNQTTNNVYVLDDGGGRIEARHWSDSTSGGEGFDGIETDCWARVTGTLKTFGSKRYINAVHIRPVKDHMEIFFHLAEVMAVQLIFDRGPPNAHGQNVSPSAAGHASASAYTAQSNNVAAGGAFSHLPPVQRGIIEFLLAQPENEEGTHVGAIARAVGANADAISEALERLMDEGHIFSTIDEAHFRVST
ncbi:replication protein A, subunit RPA32 [Artomyces pyxidatus]|uniref:Replication protein A, subunit RPA32 n=1 Tax=Artomyces pyxidatus TaxID=48021 RepID=A0ACB8TA69_9AGAM|nr:replication protein A, subunit RPA32 [Artomyces pyxidatus]